MGGKREEVNKQTGSCPSVLSLRQDTEVDISELPGKPALRLHPGGAVTDRQIIVKPGQQ